MRGLCFGIHRASVEASPVVTPGRLLCALAPLDVPIDRDAQVAAEEALHCRYKRIRPKENIYPLHYSGIETEKVYRFKIS